MYHDSSIRVMWLTFWYSKRIVHMRDMPHAYVTWLTYICVTWLIQLVTATHSYVWHDSLFGVWCLTWLISVRWAIAVNKANNWMSHVTHLTAARPYESCKIFKGRPRRNAFSKLVHRQYKLFPPDRFCHVEMKNPTRLSNKSSNAWSCAEDQILEN